jgi:hypothetical protein
MEESLWCLVCVWAERNLKGSTPPQNIIGKNDHHQSAAAAKDTFSQ